MGGILNKKEASNYDPNRQLNVVMFGLNLSGKTQMMYTGLVGNDTMETYSR